MPTLELGGSTGPYGIDRDELNRINTVGRRRARAAARSSARFKHLLQRPLSAHATNKSSTSAVRPIAAPAAAGGSVNLTAMWLPLTPCDRYLSLQDKDSAALGKRRGAQGLAQELVTGERGICGHAMGPWRARGRDDPAAPAALPHPRPRSVPDCADLHKGLALHADGPTSIGGHREHFGANTYKTAPPKSLFAIWFEAFKDPVILLLCAAAAVRPFPPPGPPPLGTLAAAVAPRAPTTTTAAGVYHPGRSHPGGARAQRLH
jgi:hypothetical protein